MGMRQRLGLAAALLGDPELLILDEPANGLDPEGVRWLREFLRGFAAEGKTVFVSSHMLAEVAHTVDDVVIINHGKLVTVSSLDDLLARSANGTHVVAPEAGRLHDLLRARGIETRLLDTHELLVVGARPAEVGEIAGSGRARPARALREHLEPRRHLPRADWKGGMTMRALLRSELVKVRSTRTSLGLLAAMIGLVLLLVLLHGLAVDPSELMKEEHQRVLLGLGLAGGFVAALIGVMSITTEFRHGTIWPTFVFTPRRGRVLAAKVFVSVAVGAVFGLLTEALALGVGIGVLYARGADLVLGPTIWRCSHSARWPPQRCWRPWVSASAPCCETRCSP